LKATYPNQNAMDRTIAASYSVRGFPHGPVSAPVTWDELPDVQMRDFTIATMPQRFALSNEDDNSAA